MSTLFRAAAVFDGHRHLGPTDVLVEHAATYRVLGGLDTLAGARGSTTETVEAPFLSPGFTDAHVHPIQGGLERMRCDLSEDATREEYLATISAYAAAHPEREWILGGGWSMPAFPGNPLAADLDAVVPDRPAFLPNRDHHGAWVNTRALEIAGITRETPDPPDGRIERDADGHPTGSLHEGATALVSRHLPRTTGADYRQALLAGQSYLHSLGVTSWQDAIVGSYSGMDDPGATYLDAAPQRRAAVPRRRRAVVEPTAGSRAGRGPRRPAGGAHGGRFRATTVKIMQDGVAENLTAGMLEPYLDSCGCHAENMGKSFVDPTTLKEIAVRLDALGFQLHFHALGDRAVRESLDAVEAARPANGDTDLRHTLAHIQVVHPDDVPRFAELKVVANMQPLWARHEDQMDDSDDPVPRHPQGRVAVPVRRPAERRGAAGPGSDWPVSTPDPLAAIHTAVTRTAHGDPDRAGTEPFLPEQALPLEVAFAAYTSGSAWANHRDLHDGAGVLAEGTAADLVVLDRDPFAGPTEEIGSGPSDLYLGRGGPRFRRLTTESVSELAPPLPIPSSVP